MTKYNRYNLFGIFLEGFEQAKKEMQEKGLLTEHTTFEQVAEWAGKHVLLTEEKNGLD